MGKNMQSSSEAIRVHILVVMCIAILVHALVTHSGTTSPPAIVDITNHAALVELNIPDTIGITE